MIYWFKKRVLWASGLLACFVCNIPAQVVINEVLYDPEPVTAGLEFIELHNAGGDSVDVGGWSFTEGIEYTIPGGTIIPGNGFLVIAQNPADLSTWFGATAQGPWIGKLSNDGETITLRDNFGTKIDELDYQRGFPWPVCPDGESMELINSDLNNDLGGSWRSSGSPVAETVTYIHAAETDWKFFKGTEEPSSPVEVWRAPGFAGESTWSTGQTSIGYGDDDDNTTLSDMQNNYSSVYLRKSFTIDAGAVPSTLLLRVYVDDGAIIWINGTEVARPHVETGFKAFNDFALNHDAVWEEITLNNADAYLVPGTNVVAVHALNVNLPSSDVSIDIELKKVPFSGSELASPGVPNRGSLPNAPPAPRQVEHSPERPKAGEAVMITTKVTDPQGVQSVELEYQVVDPGAYVRATDAAYDAGWITLPMHDNGTHGGDAVTDDDIYTATIPAQGHRTLVRYRITIEDSTGLSQRVPYEDDLRRNFSYFVYDGVPAWTGADQPGTTASSTFSTNVMANPLPVYHLLAQESDVIKCQYNGGYQGTRFNGTLVYDGAVYDHIQFRIRGENSTYEAGKNKWRFYFNRADQFQARDNYGEKYKTKFRRMNFNACASPWLPVNRGMAGLDEAVSYRMHELAGTLSPKTHYTHFRIIDKAQESSPTDQYEGDLWGLYLAVEHIDGRFLDERDLPDGNTYKIAGSAGNKKNQGPTQSADSSDWNSFRNTTSTSASVSWWRNNFDLPSYYAFRGINRVVSNVDLRDGANFGMYHHPDGHWYVLPQDLDMMFAPVVHWEGTVEMKDCLAQSEIHAEFRNSCREIMDLLLSDPSPMGGQGVQVLHELAQWINPTNQPLTFADVDQFMWNYHPRTSTGGYAVHRGQFYVNPKIGHLRSDWTRTLVSADFEGFVQYISDFITDTDPDGFTVNDADQRGYGFNYLEQEAADNAIPFRPTIGYTGTTGYPVDGLSFESSVFDDPQGNGTFGAIEWRLAEVRNPSSPGYVAGERWKYEITALWESDEILTEDYNIVIPPLNLKAGHTYRVRARHKDSSGRWSHYSAPHEFVALGIAGHTSLKLTEVHYNPAAPTPGESSVFNDDYEFVELQNTGTQPLDLYGYGLDGGIEFLFSNGAVASLQPGEYVVVVNNLAAFASRYTTNGLLIAGEYTGKLSNGGENVRLEYYGQKVFDIAFNDARGWPPASDGGGHSLIPINDQVGIQGYDILDYPGNWRASTYTGGSPGAVDPVEGAILVINELMAHTDTGLAPPFDSNDQVELYNPMDMPLVLDGHWYLSDDFAEPEKWNIPSGTTIPAGGWVAFDEDDFHPGRTTGFGLDKAGEQLVLSCRPGDVTDRVVDSVVFKGQANGASWGRFPDGNAFFQTLEPTAHAANRLPEPGIRIEELMYHPKLVAGHDAEAELEYIRLTNGSSSSVNLFSSEIPYTWRIGGGVDYVFAPSVSMAPDESLWLVPFDPTLEPAKRAFFCSVYDLDAGSVRLLGPYSGQLSNGGERVVLERPQASDDPLLPNDMSWIIVDEVSWLDEAPWPAGADGTGLSIIRIGTTAGNDSLSWGTINTIDSDGDGFSNGDEEIAGTNPADPDSFFRISSLSLLEDEGFVIHWASVTGRVYNVYWLNSLSAQPVWLAPELPYPASSYTDRVHQAETTGFYFINVQTNALP